MAAVVIVALIGFVAAALADTLVVSNTTDTVNQHRCAVGRQGLPAACFAAFDRSL